MKKLNIKREAKWNKYSIMRTFGLTDEDYRDLD